MNTRNSRRSRAAAFTLIELLTVIAIIAILMALLFPAIQSVKNTANITHAKTDEMNIVAAVKAFNTEYGKYPNIAASSGSGSSATAPTGDTLVGDMSLGGSLKPAPVSDNNVLFNILRNISDTYNNNNFLGNPRRVPFFEGRSVSNPTAPKGGFLDNPSSGNGGNAAKKGSFYDPWGTEYFIIIDTNYDNQIDISQIYTDFPSPNNLPQTGVGAFSFGKDQQVGTKGDNKFKNGSVTSDDVISWQ